METPAARCNVCGQTLEIPLHVSAGDNSVTSLCDLVPGRTVVHFCDRCGHLQTRPLTELDAYYDSHYDILLDSVEEDDLYETTGGKNVYRIEHQVRTLLEKMEFPAGARLLDYGCAKGAVFRQLAALRPDLELSLFDVSERYTVFWKDFLDPSRWATHHLDPAWEGNFDLVTSFFSLEHAEDPVAFMGNVSGLLKEGGSFYCIVPDISQNAADFLVVDHVNHFSVASLRFLLEHAGFEVTDLDRGAHRGAFVTAAEKTGAPAGGGYDIAGAEKKARETSRFWSELGERIRRFEKSAPNRGKAAIYGSGFYGTYIAASLDSLEEVACFFDRNPHRQGKTVMGKPVISPGEIPDGVETLYVGLNPDIARFAVEEAFGDRLDDMRCFII